MTPCCSHASLSWQIQSCSGSARRSIADIPMRVNVSSPPSNTTTDLVGTALDNDGAKSAVLGTAFFAGNDLRHVVTQAKNALSVVSDGASVVSQANEGGPGLKEVDRGFVKPSSLHDERPPRWTQK